MLEVNISESTITSLINQIKNELNKSGIYYRLFYRIKDSNSINEKLKRKSSCKDYKMQDLVGVRIVLYFLDDIQICDTILKNIYNIDYANCNITVPNKNTFEAMVHNYVCYLPENTINAIGLDVFENNPIDKTFEIQLRTIFSEGWHEIDHDLRYKMKNAWQKHESSERALNGIMATLETCDWSILSLLDNLSYENYKNKEWEYMIRNKYRLHLGSDNLSEKFINILNEEKNGFAKKVFRSDREKVINEFRKGIPINLNNLIFIVSYLEKYEELIEIPEIISKKLIDKK